MPGDFTMPCYAPIRPGRRRPWKLLAGRTAHLRRDTRRPRIANVAGREHVTVALAAHWPLQVGPLGARAIGSARERRRTRAQLVARTWHTAGHGCTIS